MLKQADTTTKLVNSGEHTESKLLKLNRTEDKQITRTERSTSLRSDAVGEDYTLTICEFLGRYSSILVLVHAGEYLQNLPLHRHFFVLAHYLNQHTNRSEDGAIQYKHRIQIQKCR